MGTRFMSNFVKKISAKWQSYRYRFVPWVAWNLRERTVRSVKDASQDRIVADHLVEETYRKLFFALEDNLPDQEGGGNIWHEKETKINELDRSKVSMVARRSDIHDDDGSIRCYHHDNKTPKPYDEQNSLVESLLWRTCGTFCGQASTSTWTCWRKSGAVRNVNSSQERHPLSVAQRLMQYWNGTKELFEVAYREADCRGIYESNSLLFKYLIGVSTQISKSSICSLHPVCLSALSLHPPPRLPHHHRHHSYCNRSKKFLKHNPYVVHLSHQQSTSSVEEQGNRNPSDEGMGEDFGDLDQGATIMHQTLGYAIGRRQSQIEGGGIGVYVSKGVVPKGVVVAMYPGTIYYPAEPILFQSIANPFVFRCLDGIHIDGNDKRLSKMMYRSCAQRDRLGPYMFSDLSWLTSHPLNPLAVGQYVNNQHKGAPANVCYQEFDVPLDFPLKLRKYIPNTFFSTLPDVGNAGRIVRTVALVSMREIQCGEELLSSYFTLVY